MYTFLTILFAVLVFASLASMAAIFVAVNISSFWALLALACSIGFAALMTVCIDKAEDSRKAKLYKYFTTRYSNLNDLLNKYKLLSQKNSHYYYENLDKAKTEIQELREQLPTATDTERNKLCFEIDSKVKDLEPLETQYQNNVHELKTIHKVVKYQLQNLTDKKAIDYIRHTYWFWMDMVGD